MSNHRRNRPLIAAWIVTLSAFLANFLFFWQFAGEWILPWLVLVLFCAALVLCMLSLHRAFGRPQLYRGKVSGSIVTALACLLFAVTLLFNHVARDIPRALNAPGVGQKAPEFSLTDTSGAQISLSSLLNTPLANSPRPDKKPKAVLLVFYRGYW